MKPSDVVGTNRTAWEEAALRFKDRRFAYLLKHFREPGFCCLRGARLHVIRRLEVKGKAVAQLCCNNGREILSIKNLGAGLCVGFDISENLISQARELAAAGNIDGEFHACDVHAIPDSFDGVFDLVLVTAGSLRWMPDVSAFFQVVARLLKPGGTVFINEIHPILDSFAMREDGKPAWTRSYFHDQPIIGTEGIAYSGVEKYESSPHIWHHHKLSDIVTSAVRNRLELVLLDELRENISGAYDHLRPVNVEPPFSYVMVARKKARSISTSRPGASTAPKANVIRSSRPSPREGKPEPDKTDDID